DGIRDKLVTGVQTCALPILTGTHDTESLKSWWEGLKDWEREHQLRQPLLAPLSGPSQKTFTPQTRTALLELAFSSSSDALLVPRSEERRVGTDGRYRLARVE